MKIEIEIPDEAIGEFVSDELETEFGDNVGAVVQEFVYDMVVGNPRARLLQKAVRAFGNENLTQEQKETMASAYTDKADFLQENMEVTIEEPNINI